MMNENVELLDILKKINEKQGNKIDNSIIVEILLLINKYPLEDDRNTCQDRIRQLINEKVIK
jgi:hypothetical protein